VFGKEINGKTFLALSLTTQFISMCMEFFMYFILNIHKIVYGPHFIYEVGTHSTWLKDVSFWKRTMMGLMCEISHREINNYHYQKLCPSKSHCLTIRAD
jgi:hypothetical protein